MKLRRSPIIIAVAGVVVLGGVALAATPTPAPTVRPAATPSASVTPAPAALPNTGGTGLSLPDGL